MTLIFLEVLIVLPFQVSSFSKSGSMIEPKHKSVEQKSLLTMSGSNSSYLNPLDYHVWG